jgi:SAM-dependent methyltransferase
LAAGSCTAATCSAALWHFPGLRAALGEVSRVLRAGGRLAFNVPAAQLRDAKNLPPSPLQLALARAGERRFGREPDAAGPRLAAADLLAWCREAGLEPLNVRWRDYPVTQQELADLLSVPAFGARAYAEAEAEQRDAWVAEALSSVDPKRIVHVRWWEVLARR